MTRIELLKGSYDLHVHCSPDCVPRAQSAKALAEAAVKAQMAGIGLKDHTCSTVGRCHVLNETYQNSTRFFSSIVLNPSVGGINPCAVQAALKSGCKIVYFPTFGAYHQIQVQGPQGMPYPLPREFKGIRLNYEKHSEELDQILRLIKEHDAVIATGHLSPVESIQLLTKAANAGIRRMIVTHASEPVPAMSVEQQMECVHLGAKIEHCFMACTQCSHPPIDIETIAQQIRSVGVEHVILSSDFGQVPNGSPVQGFAKFLEKMLDIDFSVNEIKTMIQFNPESLVC